MGDDNTERPTTTKKGKMKWTTSYSNMSRQATEKRLHVTISKLIEASNPIEEIVGLGGNTIWDVSDTKEKVYARLVEYLHCEPYPSMAEDDFKESNIHDIVTAVLLPTLSDFKHKSKRGGLKLHKEKEILSVDEETGGCEEYVVMDLIKSSTAISEEREGTFVLVVVEAKQQSTFAAAFRQLLLTLDDMWNTNGKNGVVYGFATTGEDWQMIIYNGTFQLTDKVTVMFPRMGEGDKKEKWMKEYSFIVDLMYIALTGGWLVWETGPKPIWRLVTREQDS